MQTNSILGKMNTEYPYYMVPNLGISHVKYGKEYIRNFPTTTGVQTLKELFNRIDGHLIHTIGLYS